MDEGIRPLAILDCSRCITAIHCNCPNPVLTPANYCVLLQVAMQVDCDWTRRPAAFPTGRDCTRCLSDSPSTNSLSKPPEATPAVLSHAPASILPLVPPSRAADSSAHHSCACIARPPQLLTAWARMSAAHAAHSAVVRPSQPITPAFLVDHTPCPEMQPTPPTGSSGLKPDFDLRMP